MSIEPVVSERPSGEAFVQRLRLLVVSAALFALTLTQAPNQVVGDTKLGIALDPAGFLGRALRLWDPTTDFGVTQNQSYGYLFPMGPFFLVGQALHLPPWIVQRTWWALLLVAAFVGLVRLAERLGIGSPTSRILAGLAFALSPRLLTTLGPISVESLPYCLAPWVLVPLIDGARSGSPRRAAARSAVAVLCMGAVNAAAVLAALPPAALWLVMRARGPRGRRLIGWWVGCVGLATVWWVVPLVLLSRYSPPFLDYIETAAATTSHTSLIEALRGTSDWLAYLSSSRGPIWPAGHALLTNGLLVALSVVVLLAGVAGMVRRDTPERLWLVTCLLLGTAALTFGHVGAWSGPWAQTQQDLLDGALVPFRNTHKFDVVVRLPLALGVAHLVHRLSQWAAVRRNAGEPPVAGLIRQRAVLVGAAAAILGAATAAVSPGLAPRQPFPALPGYWAQASSWLEAHPDGRTLLVPGSHSVDYLWGSPNDEPLQMLARSSWAVRSAVPLTPAGTIRALDVLEARFANGQPSPGLAETLSRAGVRYVLVRNDLDYGVTGSARPLLVHRALTGSPGITRVATFGPAVGGGSPGRLADQGFEVASPALEVFQVGDPVARAELHQQSDAVRVMGGPEAVLALADRGLLGGRPVLVNQAGPGVAVPTVLTDSLRRREVTFGRQTDNSSATLGAEDPYRLANRAHDYLPPGAAAEQAVATYTGGRPLASSSASDVDSFSRTDPARSPYAAVDGAPGTAWLSDATRGPQGAWWQLDLAEPRALTGVVLHLDDSTGGARATRLRVSGDHGGVLVDVPVAGGQVRVDVPGGRSTRLHVQVVGVSAAGPGSFGLTEVELPGVTVTRSIETTRATGRPVITVDAAEGDRPGCVERAGGWLCNDQTARLGEDSVALDRTVHLEVVGVDQLSQVMARPRVGPALTALLAKGQPLAITSSSAYVDDPRASARAAVDGRPGTGWRAAPGDHNPLLRLSWAQPATLTGVRLTVDRSLGAASPTGVRVVSGTEVRTAGLDAQGVAAFPGLTATSVTVQLLRPRVATTRDPYDRRTDLAPIGVSELQLVGLPAAVAAPVPPTTPVALACGQGPALVLGGVTVQTSLRTTTGALTDLDAVPLTVCGTGQVTVGDGSRLRMAATELLQPLSFTLTPVGVAPRSPVASLRPRTGQWDNATREVLLERRSAPTLLQVHENTNSGWVATLAGRTLAPVELDGWQQGWQVPAGEAGTVLLRYTPDRTYRLGLLVGLALVLGLLALAVGRERPARPGPAPVLGQARPVGTAVGLGGVLVVLVGGAAGGAAVAVALALWWVAGRWAGERGAVWLGLRLRASLAVLCLGLAGLWLALHPWDSGAYCGSDPVVQLLCVGALAGLWSTLLPEAGRRREPSRSSGRSSAT